MNVRGNLPRNVIVRLSHPHRSHPLVKSKPPATMTQIAQATIPPSHILDLAKIL